MNKEIDFQIDFILQDIADGRLEPSDIANWLHSRESDI